MYVTIPFVTVTPSEALPSTYVKSLPIVSVIVTSVPAGKGVTIELAKVYSDDEVKKILYDDWNNSKNKYMYRNNWAELWSSKVDYFEYQVNELGHNKSIVLNSFSYYVGLAENAISIVNNVNLKYSQEENNISLSHKRIRYPNMEIDYYNPLNFIFDLKVRDIAEYIKSIFFYTDRESTLRVIKNNLEDINFNNYDVNMFYARLLYPSYYFDIYEKVIEGDNEEKLLDIIRKNRDYEIFLKQLYYLLEQRYQLEKIDWIVNKKEL